MSKLPSRKGLQSSSLSNHVEIAGDLHLHTTISDGLCTPVEVVQAASCQRLQVIAITDHDAVEGVPAALQAAQDSCIEVIPGVELSTEAQDSEVHILGYFIDISDPRLNHSLASLREGRLNRAHSVLAKLDSLGMPLDWDVVSAISGSGAMGRPHIAAAMLQAGYVETTQQAFTHYLGRGGAAYVPRYKISPEQAITLIRQAGGIAVLAHPWYTQHLVTYLAEAGLAGLEAYYPGYTADMSAALVRLARQHGLLVTCGSDFHGLERLPNNPLGGASMPAADFAAFLAKRPQAA
ncbi:MAG: PHP domain-containing protein [Chloroflexi bacterium]|nr:PHP domain-containing protein [Chloroflexota bacterium]